MLKAIDPATGKQSWYYLEFHRAIGFDSYLSSNSNILNGALVHMGNEGSRIGYLLDMTPWTASWSDPALVVGQSFQDPDSGAVITTASAGSGGASVVVSYGSLPCVRANPSVSLSPSQTQWPAAGNTVSYALTVTNGDGSGCGSSWFDLGAALPAGWSAAYASSSVSIAPGASASTTLDVTSAASASDGFYNVAATARNREDASFSGSGTGAVFVVSALQVAVSTDRTSYTRNQQPAFSAQVTAAGSAAAGANVTFTVTKANGSLAVLSAVPGSNGVASARLRLNKKDPVGTYTLRADATLGGASGTGSTSFSVR
jgi:hypothetical protein